jgi:hypothetical protein
VLITTVDGATRLPAAEGKVTSVYFGAEGGPAHNYTFAQPLSPKSRFLALRVSVRKAEWLLHAWSDFDNKLVADAEEFIKHNRRAVKEYAVRLCDSDAKALASAEKCLSIFLDSNISRFDALSIGKFSPEENDLSDVLAQLFNPNASHGCGSAFLIAFVRLLQKRYPEKILLSENEIKKNELYLQVIRESNETGTRPDIKITCPDFVIFIENKARGGSETYNEDGYQSERQWKALQENKQINSSHRIGVLLSPEGQYPKCKHFLQLVASELAQAMLIAIRGKKTNIRISESIKVFLRFYADFI